MKSLQVKSYAEACEWGSGEARGRIPSGSFCPNGYSLRQALERNVGQAGSVWCKTFLGVKCVPSLTNARFSWTTVKAVEKVTVAEVGTGWAVTSCPTSGYLSQRLSAAASLKRPKCRVSEWMNKWGIKLGLDRPSRAGTVTFHM